MVVLDKMRGDAGCCPEDLLVVTFKEKAATVAEDFWFEDQHIGDGGWDNIHIQTLWR
jgi:hypothetical protein